VARLAAARGADALRPSGNSFADRSSVLAPEAIRHSGIGAAMIAFASRQASPTTARRSGSRRMVRAIA